ncbi:MAG: hypothetical protein K0R71_1404 [Bacillales bacterium]|jgi:hypothetical protein|nr:hypothetical protein [Bacillales bacterium]
MMIERFFGNLRQRQKSGNDSTNIQAERIVINNGIDLVTAKQIALDVFKANFLDLTEVAKKTAYERAEEIVDKFLKEIKENKNLELSFVSDPDFQFSFYNVQRDYARSGDKVLGEILVRLLVDRVRTKDRNFQQLVINESITVIPKLTASQMDVLSSLLLIRYLTEKEFASLEKIYLFIDKFNKLLHLYIYEDTSLLHLQYAGCLINSQKRYDYLGVFLKNNGGLFQKGFNKKEIETILSKYGNHKIFVPCKHNKEKIQFNASNRIHLNILLFINGFSAEDVSYCDDLFEATMMSKEEMGKFLYKTTKFYFRGTDDWDVYNARSYSLTSVGIVIAHANINRKLGEFEDLSFWFN